jgi:large subunit ribosomal protein L25
MKTVSLSGSLRESVGKKDAKKHRKEGKIPCVLYGGEEQVHFVVKDLDFDKIIFTTDVYLINLDVDGKAYQAILQDVQFHPVTDSVLHADFLMAPEGKPVIIGLPVRFEGNVPGVMAGGRLVKKMRKVIVKGLVADMPEFIMVDMSGLNIGQGIKVQDLKLDNIEFLDNPHAMVVMVKTARAVVDLEEEEEEEEGAEGAEGAEEGAEAPAAEE